MPNIDGGHYFLTALIPVDADHLVEREGGKISAVRHLKEVLATLPTALQSPATEKTGVPSPFAGSFRTHFARFAVIEGVRYNGRDHHDAIKVAIAGPNPVVPEPQDRLSQSFLLFAADFDLGPDPAKALSTYLAELWSVMDERLRAIFQVCVGFDRVSDAGSFAAYVTRCQVETTMPFNDYWITPPPFHAITWLLAGAVALVLLVTMLAIWLLSATGWGLALLIAAGLGAAILAAYGIVMHHGAQPFPAAPRSDLRSVLKALYLQPHFTRLAIAAQGQDDAAIHRLFGEFLARHRPNDPTGPTQVPGVVRS